MNLKTIETLAKFLGGYRGHNHIVNLEDGTVLEFGDLVNGEFRVVFSSGKVWTLEFEEGSAIDKRLMKLYSSFGE